MSRIVVFRDPQALYELRSLLFGSFDAQRRGITKCKAYEVRGPLPPSVHTTCLLLSAIHGDVPSCDLYVIRQAYSMALIRFVNEILDAAQVGRSVVPLHSLAVEARLPSAFVELRHAATHEDLPSVYILRDMARRALAWLHDEYWVHQEGLERDQSDRSQTPQLHGSEEGIEDRIKTLFREWRRIKRSSPETTDVPEPLMQKLRAELTENEPEFLSVVISRNILVPAGSGPVKSRNAVIAMWMPLFLHLGPRFCTSLADRVMAQLAAREYPPARTENRKFAIFELWAERLAAFLSADAIRMAQTAPRPWNAQIIAKYAISTSRKDLYDIAEEMAAITGASLNYEYTPTSNSPGWTVVPAWTPRPIGIP